MFLFPLKRLYSLCIDTPPTDPHTRSRKRTQCGEKAICFKEAELIASHAKEIRKEIGFSRHTAAIERYSIISVFGDDDDDDDDGGDATADTTATAGSQLILYHLDIYANLVKADA